MSSVGSAAARRKGGGLPYFMFLCKGLNVQPEAWTRSWTSDTTATLSPLFLSAFRSKALPIFSCSAFFPLSVCQLLTQLSEGWDTHVVRMTISVSEIAHTSLSLLLFCCLVASWVGISPGKAS